MRLDPAGSQAGAVEDPVRPDAGSDHSRVVDWFALTDSNLPEPRVVEAQAVSPQSATEPVPVATGRLTGAWLALRAAARRAWQAILGRRERAAVNAEPESTPAVGGPQ
jgi:hypothetical protein